MQVRKYRQEEQCFIVQGAKAVSETLASDFEVTLVAGTEAFLDPIKRQLERVGDVLYAAEEELKTLGSLESNNAALAVVKMKHQAEPELPKKEYGLVLDDIRDPGNLGTIIRTADWYGITRIFASAETTDFYNPKVINATMGSFLRVEVFYVALEQILTKNTLPVYGALLEGTNVHQVNFNPAGLIVIGNESRGISPGVKQFVTQPITIPRYGQAESLNASTATAVILDNLRRGYKNF